MKQQLEYLTGKVSLFLRVLVTTPLHDAGSISNNIELDPQDDIEDGDLELCNNPEKGGSQMEVDDSRQSRSQSPGRREVCLNETWRDIRGQL
jgi:hypothetical protein